jgi:hypothetical protein
MMDNLAGWLVARLADQGETYEGGLIDEINRVVNPPKPVGPDEVYIRAMYIVSDQVNSQGGRFAEEELDRLTELLIDAPVMVGHQRDSLPVARNFKAVKVCEGDRVWVKSYFYWMKESDGAEALKNNIDGGIYKECSISFLFLFPECSICGRDIRQCRHVPFNDYETASGGREIAHFLYRRIERVLETSLVFRGSVADTRITDTLSSEDAEGSAGILVSPALFSKLSDTEDGPMMDVGFNRARLFFRTADHTAMGSEWSSLMAFPYQPGLTGTVVKTNGAMELVLPPDFPEAARHQVRSILSPIPADSFALDFMLYATRGNDRLNGFGLAHLLEGDANLHRLRVRLCDGREIDGTVIGGEPFQKRLEIIQQLAARSTHGQLDVLRPQMISREDWPAYIGSPRWQEYNFGLEVIVEGRDRRLQRSIFSRDVVALAEIGAAMAGDTNSSGCVISLLDGRDESCRIVCSKKAGLVTGAIVLVRQGVTAGGRPCGPISIVDLLPGKGRGDVECEWSPSDFREDRLEISTGPESIELCFPLDDTRRRLIIHHFSSRLLGLGRRFVADFAPDQEPTAPGKTAQTASLEAVVRSGRLIMLRLSDNSAALGNHRRLWIRPVLLDGVERYLFYGETITGLR